MKFLRWVYIVLVFCLFLGAGSCSEEPVRDFGIPEWLEEQILEDEKIIARDPTKWKNYGAWYRYQHKNSFFYEYRNPVSSYFIPNPYSYRGKLVDLQDRHYAFYHERKCCEKLIWQAPGYYEIQ